MTSGPGVWTEEAVAAAKKYNDAGLSRSQIAKKIHEETGQAFSRNAVIGKLGRLGVLSPYGQRILVERPVAHRPKRKTINFIHLADAKRNAAAARERAAATPAVDTSDAKAMQERVKLVAARNPVEQGPVEPVPFAEREGCAFIVSKPDEPTMACNKAITAGCYCAGHNSFTHAGHGATPIRRRA